jgi:hypothetical protein
MKLSSQQKQFFCETVWGKLSGGKTAEKEGKSTGMRENCFHGGIDSFLD